MNEKKNCVVASTIGVLAIAVFSKSFFTESKVKEDIGLEKNYGIAYGTSQVKVSDDKTEVNTIDLQDIIPSGKYIYCISDTATFDYAGFSSLYNVGIQYTNHDKE